MKDKIYKYIRKLSGIAFILLAVSSSGADKQMWTEGHGDLTVAYLDNNWLWGLRTGENPAELTVGLGAEARRDIPDIETFSFLGTAGDPIWIIPQTQTENVPYMGIASETPLGVFENNRFDLHLKSVAGPGDFIMWITGGAGQVDVPMNSRDGIDESDKVSIPAPGHFHENWGFTSPGTYSVSFAAAGTPTGETQPIMSEEQIYNFSVNVLRDGVVDIEVVYENGEWELAVHEESTDTEHEADEVALHVPPMAWNRVSGEAFGFLGAPGEVVYILPQEEQEGLLSVGVAGDELVAGVFENDTVGLALNSLDGPGDVFLYSVNSFGESTLYFDSSDGISDSDEYPVSVGSHTHLNWAFTAPGIYRVGLNAQGVLADDGSPSSSGETVFLFEVFEPTIFNQGELDIEVLFENDEWEIAALDEANEREFHPSDILIEAGEMTRSAVPDNPAFDFLGEPGDMINILPQEEMEGVVFLGIAGDEIEAGIFENDTVSLQLVSVNGPGDLFLYSVDAFGEPTVFFNSADGTDESDAFPVAVGGHAHSNWAFTQPGVYRVSLQASGVLTGETEPSASGVVGFIFDVSGDMSVEPLPAYTFRYFDVEGATGTTLFGINNEGTIVGRYLDADGISQGLIYNNDSVEFFNITETTRTLALGINSDGAITGIYEDAENSDIQHGFLRSPDGTITIIDHPAEDFNYAWGINDSGHIAGYFFEDEPFMIRSWLYQSDGTFSEPFVFPDVGLGAVSRGINNAGLRTGWKWREDFSVEGFFYQDGEFTAFFDVDNLPNTLPSDVNNHGDTVGNANTAFVNAAGFIRSSDGAFRLFRVPGATQTFAYGINDHRIIVGEYQDSAGINHGFIASPAAQLDSGEIDLEIVFENNEWEIVLLDEAADIEIDPSEAVLTALESTETTVPDDEAFEFMHPEGRPIWILPQEEKPGVLFLGIAGDEIPAGIFADDLVSIDLLDVRGPGDLFLYSVDTFGIPNVYFNSRDGISESDSFPVPVGGHNHNNWAFTAPGIYEIDVMAGGILVADDEPSMSGLVTLTFEVFGELPEIAPEPEIEIEVGFEEGEWEIALLDALTLEEYPTDELELNLTMAAAEEIPAGPEFSFLGQAGDIFYLIPQNRNTEVLFLGVAGDHLEDGTFKNDEVQLHIISVDGPGDLFVYETDSFGAPNVFVNSSDGLGSDDFYPVPVGSHNHANWGFSKRGNYTVGVQASGVLSESDTLSSSPVAILNFSVAPRSEFDSGELDIEVAYVDGELELVLLDEANESEVDPADASLVGLPATLEPVPNQTEFSFLGNPGERIFILPQDEREGVLYLGIAGDEIPADVFVDDMVDLNLLSVKGPGHVFLYSVDSFGAPTKHFDSSDGISEEDIFPVNVGGHSHQNWGFTAAGLYEVEMQAAGSTVANSEEITSSPVTFFFEIIEPEVFSEGELDIEVVYEDNEWEIAFLDEANEREISPAEGLLQGVPSTMQTIPDDPALSFLGDSGNNVWILPQDEIEGILFLGLAGDEIPSGIFTDDVVNLELVEVRGAGDAFLYSVDSFGSPMVYFNSADGIDANDNYPVAVGGHAHLNWAFSAPGVYKIAVRPSGSIGNETSMGETTELTFELLAPSSALTIRASLNENGSLTLIWNTQPGTTYQIQSKVNDILGEWGDEGTPMQATGSSMETELPIPDVELKIFRVIEIDL